MGASLRKFSVRGRKVLRRICEIPSLRQCRYAICVIRAFEFDITTLVFPIKTRRDPQGHGLRKRKGRRNDSTIRERILRDILPPPFLCCLMHPSRLPFFFPRNPVIMRVARIRMRLYGHPWMYAMRRSMREMRFDYKHCTRIRTSLSYALKRISKPT
jgi:hypothetical protein